MTSADVHEVRAPELPGRLLVVERADWTNARVVDELERGMTEAGPVIAEAGGGLDGIALGMGVPSRL